MALMALGVNYRTAGVDVRSSLALGFEAMVEMTSTLTLKGLASEAVVLSTCNRTELYCVADNPEDVVRFFIEYAGLPYEVIRPYVYLHTDHALVMHLMRVTTGLDSMVLGEGEILGQVKASFSTALNAGTVGKQLGRLFQTAFSVAKEVRCKTGIGVNPVSIAYAAAKFSQHVFSDLSDAVVLLIGAGHLIRVTALHLKKMGVRKMMVANRTHANAKKLALQCQGQAFGLEAIPSLLVQADIVITGTNSLLPIVRKEMVLAALSRRPHKPMFMVDLSVPRSIEREIGQSENVRLYCMDDLETIVKDNKNVRLNAALEAERMIERAAEQFIRWLQAQDSFKVLRIFRQKCEQISQKALQEGLKRLQSGENPERVLERLTHRLTNRFLHEPTKRLRLAGLAQEEALLDFTKDLFELHHETLYTE